MGISLNIFYLLFLFLVFSRVCSQICNKTTSIIREVQETYQFSFYEAYEGSDCLLCPCTKSRLSASTATRLVEKLVNETVNVCCEGYIEDPYTGYGLKCVPICDPPCQNGFCSNPNVCTCYPGYAHDPKETQDICAPLCLENCGITDCLPTCAVTDHTIDDCQENCHNGNCIAPGVCHCNPGYTLQSGSCVPNCSCENGRCLTSGACECYYGYVEKCGTCMPFCSGCEHGKCKSPGNCECNEGYRAINGSCQPFCRTCNGRCLAPGECACDPGWYLSNGRCFPHCDVPCGNGSCIGPNICNCHSGYEARGLDAPICKPRCKGCAYACVSPEVCKCHPEFHTVYTTEDGSKCDCFDCDDPLKKCVNIFCELRSDYNVSMEDIDRSTANNHFEGVFTNVQDKVISANSQETVADTRPCSPSESIKTKQHWIYGCILLLQFILIILLLAIILKKHVSKQLKKRKLITQDKPISENPVQYTKKDEDEEKVKY